MALSGAMGLNIHCRVWPFFAVALLLLPRLVADLAPGNQRQMSVELALPEQPGEYILDIDMVLNEVARFSEQGNPIMSVPLQVAGK